MLHPLSNRSLKWLVAILLATNISTVGSLVYHKLQESSQKKSNDIESTDKKEEMSARFFREKLDLDQQQMVHFREINQNFNRSANSVVSHLAFLRKEMVTEMGKNETDRERLDQITREYGILHGKLKQHIIDYYLAMKAILSPWQQEQLQKVFQEIAVPESNDEQRRGRGRYGRAWSDRGTSNP